MPSLGFLGFDRGTESGAQQVFAGLDLPDWRVGDSATADAVLIDLDSMYGQMAWMRGLAEHQVAIGLTSAARAATPFRLEAPLSAGALADVLPRVRAAIESTDPVAATDSQTADTPRAAPEAPETLAAAEALGAPISAPPAAGVKAAGAPHIGLAERLRDARQAFQLHLDGLPHLVVDPERGQFAPGGSLKALLPFATAHIDEDQLQPLNADEAEAALAAAGNTQPLARLKWLLALGGGGGVVQGQSAKARYMLGKWPQTEREFPKHFRIATVMLKAPATVSGIALGSGASESEVADYINAALAVGHASVS